MAFTEYLTNAGKCYLCDKVRNRSKDKTFTIRLILRTNLT